MAKYYITVSLFSFLALTILNVMVHENARLTNKEKKRFYISYSLIIISTLSELVGLLLNGMPEWTRGLHYLSKFLDYTFAPCAAVFFVPHLDEDTTRSEQSRTVMTIVLGVNAIIQALSIFTGWTFYIDPANYYYHGPFYSIYALVYCLSIIYVIAGFYEYGKQYSKRNYMSLFFIMIFVSLGVVFQEFLNTDMRTICLVLSMGSMFLYIHFNEYALIRKDDELLRQQLQIERDALTGLYNRGGLDKKIDEYMNSHPEEPCTALFIDIDEFKLINDLYGHLCGDEAIRHLARSMSESFPDNSIVGRNGGDEFCILLKNQAGPEVGKKISDFSKKAQLFEFDGHKYSFTISIGYAEYPEQADGRSQILSRADKALYAVKLQGKHGCLKFSQNLNIEQRSRLGFSLNDISSNIPGAILIYKADEKEKILYANKECLKLFECDTYQEFLEKTGGSFPGVVHPDDLDRVQSSIKEQIQRHESNGNDYVDYRIITKKGNVKHVMDNGRLVYSDFYGMIFYVLLVDLDRKTT